MSGRMVAVADGCGQRVVAVEDSPGDNRSLVYRGMIEALLGLPWDNRSFAW